MTLPEIPPIPPGVEPETESAGGRAPDSKKASAWGYISLLALLAILVLPPLLVVRYAGARPALIIAGAGVWAVSVAIKHPLALLLSRLMGSRMALPGRSVAQGMLSAICELSAAGLYFLLRPPSGWNNVVAFGIGAGCIEVVYVLVLGIVEGIRGRDPDLDAAWLAGAKCSLCVRYSVPLERLLALIGHTASRGLVYAGVSAYSGLRLVLCLAVLLFAAVDGVSYYGLKTEWDWSSPSLCRRFYSFIGGISLIEAAVLVLLWMR